MYIDATIRTEDGKYLVRYKKIEYVREGRSRLRVWTYTEAGLVWKLGAGYKGDPNKWAVLPNGYVEYRRFRTKKDAVAYLYELRREG